MTSIFLPESTYKANKIWKNHKNLCDENVCWMTMCEKGTSLFLYNIQLDGANWFCSSLQNIY